MRLMALLLPTDLVRDLGWTLIHFLWQGFVLAALLYLILPVCRSAKARHNCALGALAMMGLAPIVTFLFLHNRTADGATLVTASESLSQNLLPGGGSAPMTALAPSWLAVLVAVWLAGIAVLSLRALGGLWLTQTWRRHGTMPPSDDLLRRCHSLRERLAITRPIQFLLSRRVSVPMVAGWFKPAVLIPVSAVTGLSPQQLDALILHELAHIVRLDAFANIVVVTVETILFYHPAVWWAGRLVRAEREHCCDDAAVSVCGDVSQYVEALLTLETCRATPGLSLAASGGRLKDRVRRLLGYPAASHKASFCAVVGALIFSLVIATVATAQTAMPAGHQTLSIRVVDDVSAAQQGPRSDDRVQVFHPRKGVPDYLWLKRDGQISGDIIAKAWVAKSSDGKPLINVLLTPQAGEQFTALTRANIGRRLAVVVNNRVIMAPVVRDAILGRTIEIDGKFATEAAARATATEMTGANQAPAK